MSDQFGGPGHITDADAYRHEWAIKTGRRPEEIYVPVALREPDDISAQVAQHAEEQLTLFDIAEDRSAAAAATPIEPEVPTYRTAYLVIVDARGETAISTNLQQAFNVERSASEDDIRRTSRDIADYAGARYVADWVRNALTPPDPKAALRTNARERGLVGG